MADVTDAVEPTLAAADAEYVKLKNSEPQRPYLGISQIGDECLRKLFYSFRWCTPTEFDAMTLKRFEDGHRTEDLIVQRLGLAPNVRVEAVDPATSEQFEFIDCRGHFKGHSDGRIFGVHEAPKTPHVLEIKCCNDDKFKKLSQLKSEVGVKNAIKAWDLTYYIQHIVYMYYEKFTRGFLVCATPGGRNWVSCRTNADNIEARRQIAKAEAIIDSEDCPPRGYPSETFYKCRWCQYSGLCWGSDLPQRNCRTCMFASPIDDGRWMCHQFKVEIPLDEQRKRHPCHRFNPTFVAGEQTDYDDATTNVTYKRAGADWVDNGE